MTISHDALDPTMQGPPAQLCPLLDMGLHCIGIRLALVPLLVTSGGHDWRPGDSFWLLKHIRSASGQYATYWIHSWSIGQTQMNMFYLADQKILDPSL